jgi:hypothetical protein
MAFFAKERGSSGRPSGEVGPAREENVEALSGALAEFRIYDASGIGFTSRPPPSSTDAL